MSSHIDNSNTSEPGIMSSEATNKLLQELQNRIMQLEAQLQAATMPGNNEPEGDEPTDPPVEGPTLPKKKVKIEAPDKFGGQQDRLQGFLLQMRTYIDYYPQGWSDASPGAQGVLQPRMHGISILSLPGMLST